MPEQVNNAGARDSGYVSNALENMVMGSIGPEQSDCRVNVMEFVKFDYAGKYANDPFIAVHAACSPLDGSNEGKDFDVEWVTGAKYSDFEIVNDGGSLTPKGSKSALSSGSNWALLLHSAEDCAFKSATLDGARGIKAMETIEWTLRRIAQPERAGISNKNDSGREKTYYSCLKISKMPGEKGTTRRPQQAPAASTSSAPATTAATAGGNGAGGDDSIIGFIKAALAENGNRLNIAVDLPKAVFKQAKPTHGAKGATDMGTKAKSEDFLYEHAMEQGWTIADGVLSA